MTDILVWFMNLTYLSLVSAHNSIVSSHCLTNNTYKLTCSLPISNLCYRVLVLSHLEYHMIEDIPTCILHYIGTIVKSLVRVIMHMWGDLFYFIFFINTLYCKRDYKRLDCPDRLCPLHSSQGVALCIHVTNFAFFG